MAKVNVGVVGTGYLGSLHARVYHQLKSANLICVCDIDKKRAKKVARKHRAWHFPNYSTLFDKVEAVSIAVPTNLHFKIAKDFLQNGIHVLIEKPITNTVEEAQELIDIAKDGIQTRKKLEQQFKIEQNITLQDQQESSFKNSLTILCNKLKLLKKTILTYIEHLHIQNP